MSRCAVNCESTVATADTFDRTAEMHVEKGNRCMSGLLSENEREREREGKEGKSFS